MDDSCGNCLESSTIPVLKGKAFRKYSLEEDNGSRLPFSVVGRTSAWESHTAP